MARRLSSGAESERIAHGGPVPELKFIMGDQPAVPDLPRRTRELAFNWYFGNLSAYSRVRNIRLPCSLTIYNGSTRPLSICSRIC